MVSVGCFDSMQKDKKSAMFYDETMLKKAEIITL